MTRKYRLLTKKEIDQLISQGCSCDDWTNIQVAEQFDTGKVKTTKFSGNIKLGVFDKEFTFFGGVKKPAGISNATIHKWTNLIKGDHATFEAGYEDLVRRFDEKVGIQQ